MKSFAVLSVVILAAATLAAKPDAKASVKAPAAVTIENAEIGVVDADQSTPPKLTELSHPKLLQKALEADHHHKILFKFAVKSGQEKIRVHQAFVRMFNAESSSEIIFVAEPDSNNLYKFDLDVSAKSKDFNWRSGKYELHLIVGDAAVSNPIFWHVANFALSFPSEPQEEGGAPPTGKSKEINFEPKPVIRHQFRVPEKRPAIVVSNLFTVLCLVPFAIMLLCWIKVGVNVSSFPISLSALGFHVGLGAIFGLYYYFWLQLNMFTTFKYLLLIGVLTFLCGNNMLVKIAEKRKQSEH